MNLSLRSPETHGATAPMGSSPGRRMEPRVRVSSCGVLPTQPKSVPAADRLAGALLQAGGAGASDMHLSRGAFGEGIEALFSGVLCAGTQTPEERAERLLLGATRHLERLDELFGVSGGKAGLLLPERYRLGVCETLDGLVRELAGLEGEARMAGRTGGLSGMAKRWVRVPSTPIEREQRACLRLVAQRWEQLAGACPEAFLQEHAGDSPQACVQALMLSLRDADWRKTCGPVVLRQACAIEQARLARLLAAERPMAQSAILTCLEDSLERYDREYRLTGNEFGGVKPDRALQSAFRQGRQALLMCGKRVLSGLSAEESCASRQAKLATLDYRLQRRQ